MALPLRLFNFEQTAIAGRRYSSLPAMGFGFDIFRRLDDGSPLWVAQADTLDDARSRLDAIRKLSPGRYFVRDASTGKHVWPDVARWSDDN